MIASRACRAAELGLVCALLAARASADGLIVFGTSSAGGADNAFEKIIDFSSGSERTTTITGSASSERGFDGHLWSFGNGITTTIDLPSEVADELAETWVGEQAWRIVARPGELRRSVALPNASAIELRFDPRMRRVSSVRIDEDYGPATVSFGDWRRVGTQLYPFRQEHVGPGGGRTVDVAQSVRWLASVDPELVARAPRADLAHLARPAVTVPFHSSGPGDTHIQLSATINGTPAEFVFDSGAANILTIDAAKRLGIAVSGGINIGGVGEGMEHGGFGLVDRVAIGGAALDDQSFMVIPSPFGPPAASDPAGLLGYEFLASFVTTIDYRAGTITFRAEAPSTNAGVRIPFFSDGHDVLVPGEVDGQRALFRLDTGDGGTITFFPAYAAASRLDSGKAAVTTSAGGAGGDVRTRSGTVAAFSLGGLAFRNLKVDFSQNRQGAFASRHLAGNLGARVLRCFRITIDYPHHQLWLEPQPDTPGCALAAP